MMFCLCCHYNPLMGRPQKMSEFFRRGGDLKNFDIGQRARDRGNYN